MSINDCIVFPVQVADIFHSETDNRMKANKFMHKRRLLFFLALGLSNAGGGRSKSIIALLLSPFFS